MEVSNQFDAPVALPPWKQSPVCIVWGTGRAPELVWKQWKREKSLASTKNEKDVKLSLCSYTWQYCRDYRRVFGLVTGFTDNLQIVTTCNYNTITIFRNLQISTTHVKSFQSAVFTNRLLVTASNCGDSSTAPTKSSLHRLPYKSLSTDSVTFD
jgi:hypothetical protein